MKRNVLTILAPCLLATILFISATTFAQTTPPEEGPVDVDDTAPVSRVARLSFVDGDVSFLRAGVTEWAPAVENLPLLAGDQIYTGSGARAEVQLARGNYIRLSQSTELTITELSDSAAQFEVTEGTAIIRIERLSSVFNRLEIDTPNSALVVQQDGLYRVEVRGEKNAELIVRRGEAEVSTEQGSFTVREGHRLIVDTNTGGRLELAADTTRDDWDQWSYDRDTTIARSNTDLAPDSVTTHETNYNDFYGASDLSSYGTWTSYSSYGQCWIPRVGSDWAPYRSGQWLWIPAAGWTWLSSEPWGWAPYHYGRWSYLSGLGWAWIPGFGSPYRGNGYRDYHWRPALVYFFNSPTPHGNYVGWYPLAPGERWRRPDYRRGGDHGRVQYPTPRDGSRRPDDRRPGIRPPQQRPGVTILPVEGFTRGDRIRVRPVAPGREISDSINKGARPGLPEINPTPIAAAPAFGDDDRRRLRRIAVPPGEIVRRPVVTRNPNADSTARAGAPRERRLISPRNPAAVTQDPASRERGSERPERRPRPSTPAADSQPGSDSGGERQPRKIRVPLPTPSEKEESGDSKRERRRARQGDSAEEKPPQNAESGNETRGERRHRRPDASTSPPPTESTPSRQPQRENETRPRERRPPASEARPNEDARQRSRAEEPARSHDKGASTPRAEPRPERPSPDSQTRQERHQEKEQRQERQQPQEQRRRP